MEHIKGNIFIYEQNKKTLAFIDIKGHLSGKLMKNIEYVQPRVIKELKQVILESGNEIGKIIVVDNYVFLTVRNHYNSKVDLTKFKDTITQLEPNQIYKTTGENYTECLDIIKDVNLPYTLEVYETSEWGVGWKK
jgi:hypothetical protein